MTYLYETPWWLPTGLILLGLILMFSAGGERKLRTTGFGLIALAVLLCIASYFLDSDREIAIKNTKSLAAAIEKRDWDKMKSLLHPNIAFLLWKGPDAITSACRRAAEGVDIQTVRVAGISAEQPNPDVAVQMQVAASSKDWNGVTNWKLNWEKTDAGWKLIDIEPQDSPGVSGSTLEGMVQSRGASGK